MHKVIQIYTKSIFTNFVTNKNNIKEIQLRNLKYILKQASTTEYRI